MKTTIKYLLALTFCLSGFSVYAAYALWQKYGPEKVTAPTWANTNDFFERVMEISETNFQADLQNSTTNYIRQEKNGCLFIKPQNSKQKLQAGRFQEFSIQQLRSEEQSTKNGSVETSKGRFNVVAAERAFSFKNGNPFYADYYSRVDVGALQANPANKDAVFQVASNANALELASPRDDMGDITRYIHDKTQGPAASISAAPGLIARHYFFNGHGPQLPLLDETGEPQIWVQNSLQINLLGDAGIPVRNSYVLINNEDNFDENSVKPESIKVLWHQDIQVTSGETRGDHHLIVKDATQIIHQVFTVAMNLGDGAGDIKSEQTARAMLDAAYEGTLRAAAAHGKKKVFLTLVGGGVFENNFNWIAESIEKMQEFIIESGLDVTLIVFDSTNIDEAFLSKMQELTQATDGTYTQYSPEHPEGDSTGEKFTIFGID